MDVIEKLVEKFRRFPGIGPRQARRFVFHLLGESVASRHELSEFIQNLEDTVKICHQCKRYFLVRSTSGLCTICSDKNRDASLLLIVARDADLDAIERSGMYRGLYFVLGGTVPILEKEPQSKIRIAELKTRLKETGKKEKRVEIIFALNPTPEGENTTRYLKNELASLGKESDSTFSYLGRGLSSGLELEYSDAETLKNALHNRTSDTVDKQLTK